MPTTAKPRPAINKKSRLFHRDGAPEQDPRSRIVRAVARIPKPLLNGINITGRAPRSPRVYSVEAAYPRRCNGPLRFPRGWNAPGWPATYGTLLPSTLSVLSLQAASLPKRIPRVFIGDRRRRRLPFGPFPTRACRSRGMTRGCDAIATSTWTICGFLLLLT